MPALRATYRHPRAAAYSSPGGAWDGPTLDVLLAGAMEADVARVAGVLRRAGVRRHDLVSWQLPNCVEAMHLYRACWRLGAIAAPVHHQVGNADRDHMLDLLQPKVMADGPLARADATPVTSGSARPADIAVVLFTAGSSGEPKAVLHTHRGLAHKARTMVDAHGLSASDVVLMPAPLAHISGLLNGVLVPGAAGMRTVLMERWDPEHALALIDDERVSFMIGPPTFFVGLMGAPGFSPERVGSLRLISSGGAGVSTGFVEQATQEIGARVKRSYGSTEAPTITTSTTDDPMARASTTDGRVIGEAELRVAADGELMVRGPELFAGYADPAQTRAAVSRGWFNTGDLATIEDGWLTIVGRKKDIVIRGGENIAAAEVEAVLEAHLSVRQAVVVGYPDDRLGERVCAFVVASAPFDLDACRAWFAERGVAKFKTPERIVQLEALPLLGAGKIDRAVLRERAARA